MSGDFGAELAAKSSKFWNHPDAEVFWYDPKFTEAELSEILSIGDPKTRMETAFDKCRPLTGDELSRAIQSTIGIGRAA